jgi:hypothetical protein
VVKDFEGFVEAYAVIVFIFTNYHASWNRLEMGAQAAGVSGVLQSLGEVMEADW